MNVETQSGRKNNSPRTYIKITTLCENRTCISRGVTGEHGFSALVEKNGEKLLLDTGQGLSLIPNAKAFGISIQLHRVLILMVIMLVLL